MRRPQENISELPKWAQREIERLTNNVTYFRQQAEQAADTAWAKTDTGLQVMDDEPDVKGLPKGSTIVFNLGKDEFVHIRRKSNGTLQIYSPSNALRMQPESSNVISLWCEDHR